jgi:hypothetical protein
MAMDTLSDIAKRRKRKRGRYRKENNGRRSRNHLSQRITIKPKGKGHQKVLTPPL